MGGKEDKAKTYTVKEKKRPKLSANPFSALWFFPTNILVCRGAKRPVTINDLWRLKGNNKVKNVADSVRKSWNKEKLKKNPGLLGVLLGQAPGLLLMSVFFFILNMVAGLIPTILLPDLISWLTYDNVTYAAFEQLKSMNISTAGLSLPEPPTHPEDEWGWIYVGIIAGGAVLGAFLENHALLWANEAATRIRAAMMVLIYDKTLTASLDGAPPTGKVMNLLTSDVNIIGVMLPQTLVVLPVPFQLIAIMVLLWLQIGPYSLISLGVLVLVVPPAGMAARKMFGMFIQRQEASDARVKLVTELVQAIRIVKYYAWEVPMSANLGKSRDYELNFLGKIFRWASLLFLSIGTAPVLCIALTFIFYGVFEEVNLSILFTSLSLLSLMRFVFFMLPALFQNTSQIMASVGRIQEYLMIEEAEGATSEIELLAQEPSNTPSSEQNLGSKAFVELKNASFTWDRSGNTPALTDISLRADKSKSLVMVTGMVGSGKSALAQALLGQITKTSGEVTVSGSVAYVPQTAWITNETVRNNITFGRPFDQDLYDRVVRAVSLASDFKLMASGDQTEIGERGVNLSGGQKQRISMARALYSNRDIFILDDPLSAVDAHVGKHIFEHGIKNFLKDKVVILVTNNLQFLPESSSIVYLVKGHLHSSGKFDELMRSSPKFAALMDEHGVFKRKKNKTQEGEGIDKDNTEHDASSQYGNEGKESGSVGWNVYFYWLKNAGIPLFTLFIFFMLLQGASQVLSVWWLQYWPEDSMNRVLDRIRDNVTEERPLGFYLGIYTGLTFFGVICFAVDFFSLFKMILSAARILHAQAVEKTVGAPISFFDTTPVGRIIARFSTDITIVDTQLFMSIWQFAQALFNLTATVCSIALGTAWYLLAVPPFAAIFYVVQWLYRKTSIEVQRLEALTRAPLFSHFSETLTGLSVIRAYKVQKEFLNNNHKKLDDHNSVFFALRYTQSWFGLVLGLLAACLQVGAFVLVIVMKLYPVDGVEPSMLVIAISTAPQLTLMLKMLATAMTQMEMNAVERLKEYRTLPQEPPAVIEDSRPPQNWPHGGQIEFKDYSFRYREGLPLVLKNINITVKPGERIGIVGRTGSGKSTLVSAVYRLEDAAGGAIFVDGVDIQSIGVTDLRSKLSIIPQEPTLFVGTLRYNLDPFEIYEDSAIWKALEVSGLQEFVANLPNKLNEEVKEGGSNFSVGQRQLFCLARALLRKTRILVLDEATASVDFDTDLFIQKAIRQHFPNTTLLVIAHRLNTVMDMDRILALSGGEVVEFESPKKLVKNKESLLYGMIQATGKDTAKHLIKIATGELDVLQGLSALHETEKKSKRSKKSKKTNEPEAARVEEVVEEAEKPSHKEKKSKKSSKK